MRLRTFTAPDMPAALKMVRDAMGDDAVILSSEPQKGRKGVIVTAAHDRQETPPAPMPGPPETISSAGAETIRAELQQVLRYHNVPERLMAKIFNRADPRELASLEALHQMGGKRDPAQFIRLGLEKALNRYFSFQPLVFDKTAQRLMLAGPPGVGKTLTVAKLAARLSIARQPVTVITADTRRAGGVEQLQAFTAILGLELQVASDAADLAMRVRAVPPGCHVLVDTAGANPYDADEMKELNQLTVLSGLEPLLVLSAGGDSLEAIDSAGAFMAMPLKRLLVTRADTTRRYGGIIAVAAAHKLAFSHFSASSGIIDFIEPLSGQALTQMLLRYQLQSPQNHVKLESL